MLVELIVDLVIVALAILVGFVNGKSYGKKEKLKCEQNSKHLLQNIEGVTSFSCPLYVM